MYCTDILEYLTSENERRLEILKYVMECQNSRQNTTKAMVVRHLKEKKMSSSETTHNIIKQLINEGKLNKKEITSQVHFLTINEDNDFNRLYNLLTEIEKIIDIVDKPFSDDKWLKVKPNDPDFRDQLVQFQTFYQEIVYTTLRGLIALTKEKIQYENDRQILYTRIIDYLQRYLQFEMYDYDKFRMGWIFNWLDKWRVPLYLGDKTIDVKLFNEFKDKLDKYEEALVYFKEHFHS